MNAETIRKLEADPETDSLVAEKVMDLRVQGEYLLPITAHGTMISHYSTDNNAMQKVIDVMRTRDFWWSASYKMACFVDDLRKPGYAVRFRCVYGGTRGDHIGVADTLAHATSIAALLAVMGDES